MKKDTNLISIQEAYKNLNLELFNSYFPIVSATLYKKESLIRGLILRRLST